LSEVLKEGVPVLEWVFGKELVVEVLRKPLGKAFEVLGLARLPRKEVNPPVSPEEFEEECRFSNPSPSVNDYELGLSLSESLFEQAKFGPPVYEHSLLTSNLLASKLFEDCVELGDTVEWAR